MSAYHKEARRKQQFFARRMAVMKPKIEKEIEITDVQNIGRRRKKGTCNKEEFLSFWRESGARESSKPAESKRSSRSSESNGKSEASWLSNSRSSSLSSGRIIPLIRNHNNIKDRFPQRSTSLKLYPNIPSGMSPFWFHHLNKQAKILRDHGLVLGHWSQFIDRELPSYYQT